jgi:putative DNA primase/helicase
MVIKSVDCYTTVANELVDNTVQNNVDSAPSYHHFPQTISPQHLNEWTKGSGISEEIALACLQSLTDRQEIATLLGWKAYPEHNPLGWVCGGLSLITFKPLAFCQFKPDTLIQFPDQAKPAKYLTPKHIPYDAIALPVRDWQAVVADPTISVISTEGTKKTGAFETCGYPSLGLAGVTMWQKNGKLVSNLDAIAVPERKIIICYDADSQTNATIRREIKKQGAALQEKGTEPWVIPPWDLSLGKGIDDVLANHGPEKVHKIMATAIPYKDWLKGVERQFKPEKSKTQRITPADLIARDIAEEYRSTLAFNNQSGQWMRYEADSPGIWSSESLEFIESIVHTVLTSKGIEGYGSFSYISNIVKHLRTRLIVRKWQERSPSELIPFQNGVLELATGKLLEHSPGYRFTWSMPREHNVLAQNWSLIDQFFNTVSNGNPQIKKLLLCFCNAVLKGRSDLQKFLHLIGPGGSGKGTFTRLLTDLIGQSNTHTSNLLDWCGNRFEAANAYQKRLVIFPDEDKKVGNLGRFKSLMGQDLLRAEEKGRKAFQYQFGGMVILSSNFPIFQGDNSSGMTRRTILVSFNHVPAPSDRRDLNKEFQAELSAFTNYLLTIPDQEVTATLLGTNQIAELNAESWEAQQRTNSIAAWFNDCVIYDLTGLTPIGRDRQEGDNGNTPVTLFGSYCQYAKMSGLQAKSIKNFSPDLLELCNNILKLPIQKRELRTGNFIQGLRLRSDGVDDDIPRYDCQLERAVEANQATIGGDSCGGLVEDSVEAGTLILQDCGGCGGLNQFLKEEKETNPIKKQKAENIEYVEEEQGTLSSTLPTSLTEQEIHCPQAPPTQSPLDTPQQAVNFSTFPHLTSDDYRAKEKRATQIKLEMLACATREELDQFNLESAYSESAIAWVVQNALSEAEKFDLEVITSISQPSLNLSISAPTVEMVFETVEVPVVTEPKNLKVSGSEESPVVLAENAESFVFELGDLGRFGQIIKDKVSGELYKVLEIKANGYWCRNAEGCYLMIPFSDALTDLDPDDF